MKTLENIFEVGLASVEEAKEMIIANGYDQKTVEYWLYRAEAKSIREGSDLYFKLDRALNKKDEDEKKKVFDEMSINKKHQEMIKFVFRAYKEVFDVQVFFKDFFDSYMNPDFAKATKDIWDAE